MFCNLDLSLSSLLGANLYPSPFLSISQGLQVISVATAFKREDPHFKRKISPIVPFNVCRGGFKDK